MVKGQFKKGIHGHFPIIPVKFHGKKIGSHKMAIYIQIHVITRYVIKGLQCICILRNIFQVWGAIGAQRQGTHAQYTIAGETEV